MNFKIKLLVIFVFSFLRLNGFDFWPFGFGKKTTETEKIIIASGLAEKQHQLNVLKKEKESLETKNKEFLEVVQNDLNEINKRISDIKEKIKETKSATEKEFLNKILSKLNEISQILIDTQIYYKKLLNTIEQHIELLESHIKSPAIKKRVIELKTSYGFESIQKLNKEFFIQQQELSTLSEEKNNNELTLENLKKEAAIVDKELRVKEKEQKRFNSKIKNELGDEELTIRQKGESLDLDIKLLKSKKKLLDLKIKDATQKNALINTKLFLTDYMLKIIKDDLLTVEQGLLVSETDVEHVKKDLADKKRESTEIQTSLSQEVSKLSQEKEKLHQNFEELSKKYSIHISDLKSLSDWSIDSFSVSNEPALYELGYINDRILTLDREITLKEAQRELEKKRIQVEEILFNIINSWHSITQKKFNTEEEIINEKKKYEELKNELNTELTIYKDQINNITTLLNNQNRILNNIKEKIKSLNKRQEKFSNKYSKDDFKKSITLLQKSEEQLNLQTELNNKIIEVYSTLIGTVKDLQQQDNVIINKLGSIGSILRRSEYAISLENIRNIIPDLKLFTIDLKNILSSYFANISPNIFINKLKLTFKYPSKVIYLFILIVLFTFIFVLLKKFLPFAYSILLSTRPAIKSLFFINYLMAVFVGFILLNFLSIYLWSVFFLLIKIGFITDLGIRVIFYLLSIPFLCYLSLKFLNYLLTFNQKNNYVLLNQTFQKRFSYVFIFFIFSTIIIFFFKEAFDLITYGKSELPTILLALFSIIFRASLIFLIGKEEILSIIPSRGVIWQWLRNFINRFYYFILFGIVTIMVISDPFIGGFSKLVSFILWGILLTILLLISLWWLQIFIRKITLSIFFVIDEDGTLNERFAHSKTLYGLFSIFSFLFFIFIALFISAKIWHLPVSFEQIIGFFNLEIFYVVGHEGLIPITIKSFVIVFGFLLFGIALAWFFNKFLLRRMFDVLLVDPGVQNTISSISNYLIAILILFVGFQRVGLGNLVPFLLGALAVGLAFAIKGPANDFISYFILLVERSIKIGDYVEIDENTKGVVRKISPRSIVIRRKNSVSIIVPNAKITNSAFYNWNYVGGFFAFDDISLTIPFTANPDEIKTILLSVVNEHKDILKSPAPIIRLTDFSENGYVFMVRGFLSSVNVINQWDIASDIRFAIVKSLRNKGIQIAAPVRQIYMSTELDKLKNPISNKN